MKVGDYVVYDKGNTTNDSVYKIIDYWDGGKYYEGVCVSKLPFSDKTIEDIEDMNYRNATVLDYIRTMSAEQLAEIIAFRTHYFCINLCQSKGSCRGYSSCIEEILNQPLTYEIIKHLGGI